MTVDELVKGISDVAWHDGGSYASVGRFLKEFHDAPHRSEQARSFVIQMCSRLLRWFGIASVEDFQMDWKDRKYLMGGGRGFIRVASLVGYLIEWGLLSHDLVRQHLVKPLTNHYYHNTGSDSEIVRTNAIYQLFIAVGNTLVQGLLEAEDVRVCFEMLDAQASAKKISGFDAAKLKELREIHAAWIQREQEEEQRNVGDTEGPQVEGQDAMAAEVSAEVETPVAFAPQDLPAAMIGIDIPPSILQDIVSPSALHAVESSPETFIDFPAATVSSPTFSISTVSDLTPTELGEEIEHSEELTPTCHDMFYFEDGNVEIVCGDTVFRVHSTVVSFSSPKLRDILSQPALLRAPTPEGPPRIAISDSAEDFGILLEMIYTPGFPGRHEVPEFAVFASLLRMTTKYGFFHVREQLIKDLKSAYPTKWEDFRTAKVLGEDIFGSPKPHPNAVLNLFEAQNVRFAIPFAAYRASVGGFSALISDKPGTVLPRHTLATTIHGMHVLRSMASHTARVVTYGGKLWVCPDERWERSMMRWWTRGKAGC
ncbi:hypothetical protein BDM02DRAFT_319686 [Thelephora ganbajun]|uniref:Uncharacterized protein n=1 Tax=Thelephora ganbajun TaxID=370292 RepID=A0ACB6Z8J6_THEGA|nr:hypothetical protein BDM02DRAFT_319686 [Thelephora ganbajun]